MESVYSFKNVELEMYYKSKKQFQDTKIQCFICKTSCNCPTFDPTD